MISQSRTFRVVPYNQSQAHGKPEISILAASQIYDHLTNESANGKTLCPRVRTDIRNESIATFINTHFMCKFLSCCEDLSEYRSIIECEVSHRSYVLARDEQNVLWRLWVDIHKRHYILILIDDVTGYLTSSQSCRTNSSPFEFLL